MKVLLSGKSMKGSPGSESDNQLAVNLRQPVRQHDQAAIGRPRKFGDRALNLGGIAHVDWTSLQLKRRRNRVNCAQLPNATRYGRITKNCYSRYARRDLFKQFRPLSGHAVLEVCEPGGVAT